jgi:thioredoxin reductase
VRFKIAIVGSGPAGLSAAARAAELGLSHVLLEAEGHLSNTIYRYQKGKHVMAEPGVLPLRSPLQFVAGRRENVLENWQSAVQALKVNVRCNAEVTAIAGSRGAFIVTTADGEAIEAEHVVLAIGLQGNIRKLGCSGENLDIVQYQLDDPDEYQNETIVVVGAGDAAIENALALADHNKVYILNRRDEFDRAKDANNDAILKAIADSRVSCFYETAVSSVEQRDGASRGVMKLSVAKADIELPCDRIIARLGATPARKFVESCGVKFPSTDPNSVPAVSATYESNVPGLHIIGALAGFPLIKQAMNQGYEVIEFIEGRATEPADAPLLRAKFAQAGKVGSVDAMIDEIRAQVPLMASLTALQLREFLLDSNLQRVQKGQAIFRLNDYSDTIYFLLSGNVEIAIDSAEAGSRFSIQPGEFFGEMSLISGRRRSARATATSECVLIETPRRSMNKLIASSGMSTRRSCAGPSRAAWRRRCRPVNLPNSCARRRYGTSRRARFFFGKGTREIRCT